MPDLITLQNSFLKKQEELIKLQDDIKAAQAEKFTSLPAQVGLKTIDELIKALVSYASPRLKGSFATLQSGKPSKRSTVAKAPKAARKGKGTRTRITDEIRDNVVAAAKSEEMTGAEIAAKFGISLPSVANIKKAAGLTKKRTKK